MADQTPPDGPPRHRLLTGSDDAAFCLRVAEALDLGFELYGSPAVSRNVSGVTVAQALVLPVTPGEQVRWSDLKECDGR